MTEETRIIIGAEKPSDSYSDDVRFLRFRAYPVRVSDSDGIRNFSSGSYDHSPLADLVISAQVDSSDPMRPYGFEVGYRNLYSLNLREAEANVKLLRKLDKGLEKLNAEFGYADSYAMFVARVGKVLGVKLYGWTLGDRGWYSENDYRWTDATGIAGRIDHLTREWAKTAGVDIA
jgi:hypothetical protein